MIDLCVQACSDDPQVAVHAIRNLARIGFGRVALRWSQLGLGRTSSTSTAQTTPRNLFGFKDGTNNLKAQDGDLLKKFVWVGPSSNPAGFAVGVTSWLDGSICGSRPGIAPRCKSKKRSSVELRR